LPRLCEFCPGICLITEEKARRNLGLGKKNLSQVNKNLSQCTVYILPKHPHITKPTQTHTLQNPHIHTQHTHTHTHHTHTYIHTHTCLNFCIFLFNYFTLRVSENCTWWFVISYPLDTTGLSHMAVRTLSWKEDGSRYQDNRRQSLFTHLQRCKYMLRIVTGYGSGFEGQPHMAYITFINGRVSTHAKRVA